MKETGKPFLSIKQADNQTAYEELALYLSPIKPSRILLMCWQTVISET